MGNGNYVIGAFTYFWGHVFFFHRTPFHADVLRSFSWSANVCGKKRWILVPAGQEKHLQDHLGNLPYDVTSCGKTDNRKSYTPMEVVQSVGEVIFVPSGWHHQVFNMVRTMTLI